MAEALGAFRDGVGVVHLALQTDRDGLITAWRDEHSAVAEPSAPPLHLPKFMTHEIPVLHTVVYRQQRIESVL